MVMKVVKEKIKFENEDRKTARLPKNVLKKFAPSDMTMVLISSEWPIPL